MKAHLREQWRKLAEAPWHEFYPGDRVVVNHPEIGEPVYGYVTRTITGTTGVYVRFDHVDAEAMVQIDMLEMVEPARVGKQSGLRTGPGVFWRTHRKGTPFEVGGGSSQINFTEEELATHNFPEPLTRVVEGYSAFSEPWHLWQYVVEMGWANDIGDWLTAPVDVIGFEGKVVGSGWDGEPTVRPISQPFARMSWEEFNRQVEGGIGPWYDGINMPLGSRTAMKLREAQEKYEQRTLVFSDGRRLRVWDVIESGKRFCTAFVQRINRDGSVDARDANGVQKRTFTHSDVVEIL